MTNLDIFRGSNGKYSAKRLAGFICLIFSIYISTHGMLIDPEGVIDMSVQMLSLQFMGGAVTLIMGGVFEKYNTFTNIKKQDNEHH